MTITYYAGLTGSDGSKFPYGTILMAEGEDGHTQPAGLPSCESEMVEMLRADFSRRLNDPENSLCPDGYLLWAQSSRGYEIAAFLTTTGEGRES